MSGAWPAHGHEALSKIQSAELRNPAFEGRCLANLSDMNVQAT